MPSTCDKVAAGQRSHRADHGEERQQARSSTISRCRSWCPRAGRSATTASRASTPQGERSTEKQHARRSSGGCRPTGATRQLRTAEYVDIRDDRVQRYFSLQLGRVDLLRDAAQCGLSRQVLSTGRQRRSHVRRQAAREAQGSMGRSGLAAALRRSALALARPRPPPHARGGGACCVRGGRRGSGALLPEPLFDAPRVLRARSARRHAAAARASPATASGAFRRASDGAGEVPPRAAGVRGQALRAALRRGWPGHRARLRLNAAAPAAW